MNWQNTVQKPVWAFREDGVRFYTGITLAARGLEELFSSWAVVSFFGFGGK